VLDAGPTAPPPSAGRLEVEETSWSCALYGTSPSSLFPPLPFFPRELPNPSHGRRSAPLFLAAPSPFEPAGSSALTRSPSETKELAAGACNRRRQARRPRRRPRSPPSDSPPSGDPRPCQPCGRPRGGPPRLLPCSSSPRSPCFAAVLAGQRPMRGRAQGLPSTRPTWP
jgi:hypothetical protein